MATYKDVGGIAPVMPPEEVARKQQLAKMLMEGGQDTSNMRHWTQALGSVLQTGVGSYLAGDASRGMAAGREQGNKALAQMLMGGDPSAAMANPYVADKALSYREKISDRGYAEGKEKRDIASKSALAAEAGLKPGTPEFMEYVYGIRSRTGSDYGKAGTIFQNPETGAYEAVQFGSDGTIKRTPLDGITPFRGVGEVDTGTGTSVIDKATGKTVRTIDKNIADAEALKKIGAGMGEAAAGADSDIGAAETALELVDSIRTDKNRPAGTAIYSPVGNLIPKTPGLAFEKKVEQAKSGAFLTAIQQLRGMGALSNAEGQTATAAVTRMSTATLDSDFEEALTDYEKLVLRGQRKAQKMKSERDRLLRGGGTPAPPVGGAPSGLPAGEYVYNPATGKVERR